MGPARPPVIIRRGRDRASAAGMAPALLRSGVTIRVPDAIRNGDAKVLLLGPDWADTCPRGVAGRPRTTLAVERT